MLEEKEHNVLGYEQEDEINEIVQSRFIGILAQLSTSHLVPFGAAL